MLFVALDVYENDYIQNLEHQSGVTRCAERRVREQEGTGAFPKLSFERSLEAIDQGGRFVR